MGRMDTRRLKASDIFQDSAHKEISRGNSVSSEEDDIVEFQSSSPSKEITLFEIDQSRSVGVSES